MFDEAAPPEKPHIVVGYSIKSLIQGFSTVYEATIAQDMKLSGLQRKKALAKASAQWTNTMSTHLPQKSGGEPIPKPSPSEWIHPALLEVVKESAADVAAKGAKAAPKGEAGSSSDQKKVKVEPQPAEEGTKRRLPDKTTPPTPPPRPPKTARKA